MSKIIKDNIEILMGFITFIVIAIILAILSKSVSAEEIWYGTDYQNNTLAVSEWVQTFNPGTNFNNITKIELANGVGNWWLCRGNINSSEIHAKYNCNNNTFIASGTTSSNIITFNPPIEILYSENYYIAGNSMTLKGNIGASSEDKYTSGSGFCHTAVGDNLRDDTTYSKPIDFYTKIYTETDYTINEIASNTLIQIIDIENDFGTSSIEINIPEHQKCNRSATSTCLLAYTHNDYSVGSQFNFYWVSSTNNQIILPVHATGTIEAVANNFNSFDFTHAYISGHSIPFCVVATKGTEYWSNCGYIDFYDDTEIANMYVDAGLNYDINEACADMDETASTTFRYGIECGFRKIGYWLFKPSVKSVLNMWETTARVSQVFPINIYTTIKDTYIQTYKRYTIRQTEEVAIPLVIGTQVSNVNILEDGMFNRFGILWTKINQLMELLIYTIFGYYILNKIFSLSSSRDRK